MSRSGHVATFFVGAVVAGCSLGGGAADAALPAPAATAASPLSCIYDAAGADDTRKAEALRERDGKVADAAEAAASDHVRSAAQSCARRYGWNRSQTLNAFYYAEVWSGWARGG